MRVLLRVVSVQAIFILDEEYGPGTDEIGKDHQADIGSMDRDAADFGLDRKIVVRGHAVHDRDDVFGKVGRQLDDIRVGYFDSAPW